MIYEDNECQSKNESPMITLHAIKQTTFVYKNKKVVITPVTPRFIKDDNTKQEFIITYSGKILHCSISEEDLLKVKEFTKEERHAFFIKVIDWADKQKTTGMVTADE